MRKLIIAFFVFVFNSAFSQSAEFEKIDNEVAVKQKDLKKKYKKRFPEERKREELEIENFRRNQYEIALENIKQTEEVIDLDTLRKSLTKEAEYEKGLNEFRNLFMQNFDTSRMETMTGMIKTEVRFLIDENGNVSNAEAIGNDADFNREGLITLYRIRDKGKWKPAEINGVPVKAVYKIPLMMKFEN